MTVLGIEKRCRPRIPIAWPVVLQTPHGSIKGEAKDISVGGAFIQYSEEADLNSELLIVLKVSDQRSIALTGRKVWSGNFNIDGKAVFSGIGVRFTDISSEDREFISSLVSDYLKSSPPSQSRLNPTAAKI
jgi:Tfp pilus assembly protein PilZ